MKISEPPPENEPSPQNEAAQIDVQPPTDDPAGDPTAEPERTSWGAEIPPATTKKVRDEPQA